MDDTEIRDDLNDPFATLVLRKQRFPMDATQVIGELGDALPEMHAFLASEAGKIGPTQTQTKLERNFRWVITRADPDQQPDLLISSPAEGDLRKQFLQIVGWDDRKGVFNYYQRQEGAWIYSGDSDDALVAPSRGAGAFDSHVNGSLVMKELKRPWQNWHSSAASIDLQVGDATLRNSMFVDHLTDADELEILVRAGIHRWTTARFDRIAASGTIADPLAILRQAVCDTTFNLRTVRAESAEIDDSSTVSLPLTFFIDEAALLSRLAIDATIPEFEFSGGRYRAALERFAFRLQSKSFRKKGDTFFAVIYPEPAAEDFDVLNEALPRRRGWISERFAACALMVDFPNPVRSPKRRALLRHAPASAPLDPGAMGDAMAANILAAPRPAESAEAEFARNWEAGDGWREEFGKRISAYLADARTLLDSDEGFTSIVELADSRRREIRPGVHPLSEFDLLYPRTNVPVDDPFLQMSEEGRVVRKPQIEE